MADITLAAANVRITHDKRENLSKFLELIAEASRLDANVLVFPEVGLQGFTDPGFRFDQPEYNDQRRYYMREAETIPGPATETVQRAIQGRSMYVQLGMAEIAAQGNVVYNSTALIGPDGVVGVFRKVHAQWDYPWFNMGESIRAIDTPIAKFGSLICYDICFPELSRTYALQGAHILLMSTAWPMMRGHDRENDYDGQSLDLMARATAFMNQVWLVVSNHCEKNAYTVGMDYYGGSQIVDPGGRVLAYRGDEEGLIAETVDLTETIWRVRTHDFQDCNFLQDRRPELYGAIVDQSFKYPDLPQQDGLARDVAARRGAATDSIAELRNAKE